MHEVLVNRLGGLSLPRKSVVRLTDRPDMTFYVYRGRKTTTKQIYIIYINFRHFDLFSKTVNVKLASGSKVILEDWYVHFNVIVQ